MCGMCLSTDYMFFVEGFILCGRFLSRQYKFFLQGFKLHIFLRNKCILKLLEVVYMHMVYPK